MAAGPDLRLLVVWGRFPMGFGIVFDDNWWFSGPFGLQKRFCMDTRPPEDLLGDLPRTSTPDPGGHAKSMKNQGFSSKNHQKCLIFHWFCMVTRIRAGGLLEVRWRSWGGRGVHRKTFLQAKRTGKPSIVIKNYSKSHWEPSPGHQKSKIRPSCHMSREAQKGPFLTLIL